ncbi:MAG: N-acyl homoserine lactonase family protein [Chloroflexota bacterium]
MNPTTSVPQRLYLIEVARIGAPMNRPVVCYLIQTSDGKNILIDTGLATDAPISPEFPPVQWEKNVIEQLALIGLKPQDINTLICTHFDMDHASYHGTFTHAEFVVQQRHYDDAQHNMRYGFARPQWDRADVRWNCVNGDTELLPGIDLIATDGHALGHQSVLVSLPETGKVLLAIDAVLWESRFRPDVEATPRDEDESAVRASTQKLLDLVKTENVALTIFGHDGAQWTNLKKLPEFYG